MLSRVEHVKSFITSGLSLRCWNMLLWYLAHIGSVVILPNGAEVEPIPCIKTKYRGYGLRFSRGWSGCAMALGKLLVSGRPANLDDRQGPPALAVGAGGVVWTFLLSSILSLLSLPLFGRRPDID